MRQTIETITCWRCGKTRALCSSDFAPSIRMVVEKVKHPDRPMMSGEASLHELCTECSSSFESWLAIPSARRHGDGNFCQPSEFGGCVCGKNHW